MLIKWENKFVHLKFYIGQKMFFYLPTQILQWYRPKTHTPIPWVQVQLSYHLIQKQQGAKWTCVMCTLKYSINRNSFFRQALVTRIFHQICEKEEMKFSAIYYREHSPHTEAKGTLTNTHTNIWSVGLTLKLLGCKAEHMAKVLTSHHFLISGCWDMYLPGKAISTFL